MKACRKEEMDHEHHIASFIITSKQCLRQHYSLGPFNIEDEMVVTESRHPCDGPGCILAAVETDEGKALQTRKAEDTKFMLGF